MYPPDAFEQLLEGDVTVVAPRLLGDRMMTEFGGETTEVMLTEVEADAGERDPASHAYRGRTNRNRSMFGPAGTLYVYRSYGIHWCMNLVVAETGVPYAILLRGGIPLAGRPVMERRRGRADHLADGPGKLTYSGIAVYHPRLFEGCSPGKFSMVPLLRRAMREHFVTGERYDGPWNDIGSPERLEEARRLEAQATG